MVLGGLKVGVNPLEMAHAFETLAEGGQRISGTLAPTRASTRSPTPGSPTTPATRLTRTTRERPGSYPSRSPTPRRAFSRPWSAQEPVPTPPESPTTSGARRARPRTTATPGSAARQGRHGLRVGRPRRLEHADGDRVRGPAGRRRHLPRGDLARHHRRYENLRPRGGLNKNSVPVAASDHRPELLGHPRTGHTAPAPTQQQRRPAPRGGGGGGGGNGPAPGAGGGGGGGVPAPARRAG